MDPGELKPILSTLVLPPAGPLLLALLGVALGLRHRRTGAALALAGILAGLLLATNGAALWLGRTLLPPVAVVAPAQLKDVQAIVVLGGGLLPEAPEYGTPQPSSHTLARLRYGAWLARQTGKPLAYAGGIGWGAAGTQAPDEASVARRVLQEDYGLRLQWADMRSRDTEENAQRMAELMGPGGIRRIALVSDAWHLPRAAGHFRAAGFDVVAAPTRLPSWQQRPLLEWLPSAYGLSLSRQVLREWLGLLVTGARQAG